MSRKVVGSSSSSRSVSWARAIAIHTRCRWPPDSSSTGRSASSATSRTLHASVDRALVRRPTTAATSCWCGCRPRETRSATVIAVRRAAGDCGSRPRRAGDLPGRERARSRAVQQHRAAPGLEQPAQGAQQGGLAAGVGADDHGDLAVGDVQVEPVARRSGPRRRGSAPAASRRQAWHRRAVRGAARAGTGRLGVVMPASAAGCGRSARSGRARRPRRSARPTGSSVGENSLRASRSATHHEQRAGQRRGTAAGSARSGSAGGRSAGRAAPRSPPGRPRRWPRDASTTPSATRPSRTRPSRTPSAVAVSSSKRHACAARRPAHSSTGSSDQQRQQPAASPRRSRGR